jgi:hypothetical protein
MQFPFVRGSRHIVGMVVGAIMMSGSATAEPLSFSDVQALWLRNGFFAVDLFGNPVLAGTPIEIDGVRRAAISFHVPIFGTLPPGETDTLRFTFGLPTGDRPFSNILQELTFSAADMPNAITGGMDFPILYHPERMTLTLDLLRSSPDFRIPGGPRAGELVDSFTYSFSVVQPVPEPTSLWLLGSGLCAIVYSRRQRRNARREHGA